MTYDYEDSGITMKLYGQTPVQAIGSIEKHPFYFRARYGQWRLEVYDPGTDLSADSWPEPPWSLWRDWIVPRPFAAGYMTHLQALRLITAALRIWQQQQGSPKASS